MPSSSPPNANDPTLAPLSISTMAEALRSELVRLTTEFVSFPTVNPPGTDLVACQKWICTQLTNFGIPFEIIDSSTTGGDHRVIVGTIGDKGPVMYLHGHYDVVPVFNADQFKATESDGILSGRGTCDMKGGLIALLLAAVIHRDRGGGGQIKLVFVPDEETGGINGSERLEELGVIDSAPSAGAIVAEPSFPNIWYAARAAFTVEVTVRGKPAHVGLHYTGSNAFLAAHHVVNDLMLMANDVSKHTTEFRIEPEAARQSIMLIGGTSGGGTNFNVVPDTFQFTIDRRPNPDEDYAHVKAELLQRLDTLAKNYPLTYEILQDVDPAHTATDSTLTKTVESAILAISGRSAPLAMCPGCLETRVYTRAGIDAVALGPGPMSVMHAPDEHVPVDNLVEACAVYATVLQRSLPRRSKDVSHADLESASLDLRVPKTRRCRS
ncbi:MAG: ArgE/DapE family deacylase [Acidimicrobiales bacterium]|nr:ArgE/DapE family deacylase [Acidimicrobiales bacterium]